jgi:hypothetical protein
MPRRCPNLACQRVIDDDKLLACPECRTLLSTTVQVPTLSQEQLDRIVIAVTDNLAKSGPVLDKLVRPIVLRIVKSVHWWIAFPLFWIAVLVGSHFTNKGALESLMISRIDQEFREPRIQATMQKVVNDKANEMLTNEIQPAVDGFRDETAKQVEDFHGFLQNEYQTVSAEVARLRIQSYLPILGDKVISEGDRAALEEIIRIARTETDSLKEIAIREFERVYTRLSSHGAFPLRVKREDGTTAQGDAISTSEALMILSHSNWAQRVTAASFLGDRRQKGVPDSLLKVASTDQHIKVVYYAVLSFHKITRPTEQTRRPAGASPRVVLSQAMEMFDIDNPTTSFESAFGLSALFVREICPMITLLNLGNQRQHVSNRILA